MTSNGSDGAADSGNPIQDFPNQTETSQDTTPSSVDGGGDGDGGRFPIPKNLPAWAMWTVGTIVLLAIPFYKRLWKNEGVLEKVVSTVAEDVDRTAPIVKKVTEGIEEYVPKDSALKKELDLVEKLADEAAEGADEAQTFIKKVDELKEKIEKIVEPIFKKQGKL